MGVPSASSKSLFWVAHVLKVEMSFESMKAMLNLQRF